MSRQEEEEENAIINITVPKVNPRLFAWSGAAKQSYYAAFLATVTAIRTTLEARHAAGAANDARAYNNNPGVAGTVATANSLADGAYDAAVAAYTAFVNNTPALDLKSRVIEIIAEEEEGPTTTKADQPTSSAESATVTTQPEAGSDDDDKSNFNKSTHRLSRSTRPKKTPARHLNNSPEPNSMHRLFLGLTIAAVLGAIFLRNNEVGLFMALLVFVLTILVPFCWSDRVFKWSVASYAILAAACVLSLVVGCIQRLATGESRIVSW